MKKVIGWVLGFTKIGKIILPIQKFLSGKKTYIAGAALLIPGLLGILDGVANSGMDYLMNVTGTPEWRMFLEGIAAMGLRASITKASDPSKDPNVGTNPSVGK